MRKLVLGAKGHLRKLRLLGSNIRHQILDNLDHENSIISFSCHGSMSKVNILTKTVASKVALAARSFSANGSDSIKIPNNKTFVNAAHHQDFMLQPFRLSEDLFDFIVAHVNGNRSCQKWNDCILLKLI